MVTKLCLGLIMMLFVTSCMLNQRRAVDVHYVVPDNYEGPMAIRFRCPNGEPLQFDNKRMLFRLDDDGTACIRDAFVATHGTITAETASGQPVRYVGSPWDERGRALYLEGTRGVYDDGQDFTLEILWIGDMEVLDAIRNTNEYGEQLGEFLETRFGIQRIRPVEP